MLALCLAAILALDDALETTPPLPSPDHECGTLLPWFTMASNQPSGVRARAEARRPIKMALACVQDRLAKVVIARRDGQASPAIPKETGQRSAVWWWQQQAELMVGAVWQEARWRSGAPFPDEASYLAVGEASSAVGWIGATLRLLDGATVAPSADSQFVVAARAVSAALRLANDLHDTRRERREGKVQFILLRSRTLEAQGHTPLAAWRRARRDVQRLLALRVSEARTLLAPQSWDGSERVRTGLAGLLAAALAPVRVPGSELPAKLGSGRTAVYRR